MNRFAVCLVSALVSNWLVGTSPGQENANGKLNASALRVGVYDSRAIALAWAPSQFNKVGEKMKEYEAAKKSNDIAKMRQLEDWGTSHQRLLHFQGFGRVPVGELLEPVEEGMKQLMNQKNLAVITMGCDLVADHVEVVDITLDLVELFEPSGKTVDWVKQLQDKEPLSLIELAKLLDKP